MPLHNNWQNHFYSVNIGPAHFIFLNIDLYYEEIRTLNPEKMINAIKADLALADTDANREIRPWIIAFAHYPIYCSDNATAGCTGGYFDEYKEIEELLYKHNVDLFIAGHVHAYERFF